MEGKCVDNANNKMSFKRFLELYAIYARMDLDFLRDWKVSVMCIIADMLSNIASVSGVFLLAWRFDGIGGMSRWDVLFMLGYVTCITGLFQMFFSSDNTGHISRVIGRGQLDHIFIQPIPLPVHFMTAGFIPFTGCQNLIFGIGIVIWSLDGMGKTPGILWILCLIGYLFISMTIIIGLSYLFSSLTFKWQIAFEEISSTVIDRLTGVLSNYPLSGMPVMIQWTLVTVMPAGLLGWFPACALLLDKPPLGLSVFYPLIIAVLIWTLAAFAFRKGFKYYVRIGSNRYSPYGRH
ncbi:MAG: ABC transporter permease [Oscillospiraceae bacterium]|nr:ABC transporter permease [Oscillospiraceae bacterium]